MQVNVNPPPKCRHGPLLKLHSDENIKAGKQMLEQDRKV